MPEAISKWVAASAEYRPDRYYRYAHLTEMLHNWAKEHPSIVHIDSIGKTYEGRDIWVLTLTNVNTGAADEKPAFFVDANIHAGEVTGQATVLWLLNHLLTQYGKDDHITRLLDESVLYAIPGIMLDGIEMYLTTPERMRSSVRPYPEPEVKEGLVREDIDGNGVVLHMRISDPNGPWKISPEDDRVMIRREPDEQDGEYYYVLPEGMIKDWDGGAIKLAPDLLGLDLNRNFPHKWAPEWQQKGAGELPLSEPETRALAEFLTSHPNIYATQHFHTQSGLILRPSSGEPDEDLPKFDLAVYKALGKMGEEETGYKCVSIYHDFAYDKKVPIFGAVLDWVYGSLGAYAFTTELWSLPQKAGIELTDHIGWAKDHPVEDDLALARALDEHAGGEGYYRWEPFDHPQLGPVEIGGMDYKFAWQNPPGSMLEEVTAGNARFVIRKMGTAPRIVIDDVSVEKLADGVYKIAVLVQNTGFLPTWVSERGKATGRIKPVRVSLSQPEGATLVSGKAEQELGHLHGRANQYGPIGNPARWGNESRGRVEWVVSGEPGTELDITAESDKAGTVRATTTLP